MKGTQQRSLVVERLARVRNEYGGNTQRVVDDEDRAGGVPGRVATSLERVADAAVGETAGIRLLLYQQFAAELLNHAALAVVLDEGIVLLGRAFSQWLEPVRIMGDAHLLCPLLHPRSHGIGYRAVEPRTVVHHVNHLVVNVLGQVLIHLLTVKHVLAEVFRRSLCGGLHVKGLLLESLFHNLES